MDKTVEQLTAEVSTLKSAFELLGFDSNAVVTLLQRDGDRVWREMPFLVAAVEFSAEKASKFGLSENGISATEVVFQNLRKTKLSI